MQKPFQVIDADISMIIYHSDCFNITNLCWSKKDCQNSYNTQICKWFCIKRDIFGAFHAHGLKSPKLYGNIWNEG